MANEEVEHITSSYYCTDPIENFKIKVILKPIKNLFIPLPQFDESKSLDTTPGHNDSLLDVEEHTFRWQEKLFSDFEIKRYSTEPNWKKILSEKYNKSFADAINPKNYPKKLFSYVDVDNYSYETTKFGVFKEKNNFISPLAKKISRLKTTGQNNKNFKNIPKRNIINYHPSNEFKNQSHFVNRRIQKMYIMVDLGPKTNDDKFTEGSHYHEILCVLNYDTSNKILEITPSFSKTQPYIVRISEEDKRNSYYYWLYHASTTIPAENLSKEIKFLSQVFGHQEELKKLQVGTDFAVPKPNYLYFTLLIEISSAKNFENEFLNIHYVMKLPQGWECNSTNTLTGRTQTSCKNSLGINYFSYLSEMNFIVDLEVLDNTFSRYPELFFEVLSVDKCNIYRNEGYTYVTVPGTPGMFKYDLKCWRALDKTINSELRRFFVGGGPQLNDISYVGLSASENVNILSRFGFQTVTSGEINIKLSVIHQAEILKNSKRNQSEGGRNYSDRLNCSALLGNVNTVLEAFRKARERMLEVKKGLEMEKPCSE